MDISTNFRHILSEHGQRMTWQRQLILDVLEESRVHLDAEALHDLVKSRDPRVGIATVYRTLALLKELGLVKEYDLGEEHGHFEASPETPHYHFTCLACKRVLEFKAPAVPELVRAGLRADQVELLDISLSASGYCWECLHKQKKGG
jgi:Fur family ferric uptake transcriptional regulator